MLFYSVPGHRALFKSLPSDNLYKSNAMHSSFSSNLSTVFPFTNCALAVWGLLHGTAPNSVAVRGASKHSTANADDDALAEQPVVKRARPASETLAQTQQYGPQLQQPQNEVRAQAKTPAPKQPQSLQTLSPTKQHPSAATKPTASTPLQTLKDQVNQLRRQNALVQQQQHRTQVPAVQKSQLHTLEAKLGSQLDQLQQQITQMESGSVAVLSPPPPPPPPPPQSHILQVRLHQRHQQQWLCLQQLQHQIVIQQQADREKLQRLLMRYAGAGLLDPGVDPSSPNAMVNTEPAQDVATGATAEPPPLLLIESNILELLSREPPLGSNSDLYSRGNSMMSSLGTGPHYAA